MNTYNGNPDKAIIFEYDQGPEKHLMFVGIDCTNFPTGVDVAFFCDSTGPEPRISMERSTINTSPLAQFYVRSEIPAEFRGNIIVEIWRNGKTIPNDAKVEMTAFYFVNEKTSMKTTSILRNWNQIT